MATEIKAINAYLNRQRYEGGIFSGLRRVFNEADAPGFNWDRGGRLYAVGGELQMMKKRDRLAMRINGEPVVELDVNASFLRIFALSLTILCQRVRTYTPAAICIETLSRHGSQLRWVIKAL